MQTTIDRVHTRIPRLELERRWALVRDRLEERNIDALVVLTSDDFLGGYTKWFTDRPAISSYHTAVIFHRKDLMTVIDHGSIGMKRTLDGNDLDYPGVGEVLYTAAFRVANYTHRFEAELVAGALEKRAYRRVALVGAGAMPYEFVVRLKEISNIEFVDETDFIDRCKAVKSELEIKEIRRNAAIQDEVFAEVLTQIRPGMRDMDVQALVQQQCRVRGSEQGVYLSGSAAPGSTAMLQTLHYQARRFEKGDVITILIENNGPSGFYCEMGRSIVFGKAPSELIDGFAFVKEAQEQTIRRFRPGVACADIAEAYDEFLGQHGLPPERRLFAHGQGYDLVERPLIRADEPMALAEGMLLVAHPAKVTPQYLAYICDNYLVAQDGPTESLHRTERKVFELN